MSDSDFEFKDVSRFEASVIGQILMDPASYEEANLRPEHFSDQRLQVVMRAIERLKSKGQEVDALMVSDIIKPERLQAMGGLAFLSGLLTTVVTTSNVAFHAEKVRDAWLQRECGAVHDSISSLSRCGASGEEMVALLRDKVDELESGSSLRLPSMAESYEEERKDILSDMAAIERGETLLVGLPDGLGLSAVVPGGIPIDKVTTLFGESGNFKTTTKNNLVWGIAMSGLGSVLDVSLEDANRLSVQRFIARQTGLPYGSVATRKLSEGDADKIGSISPVALEAADRIIMGGDMSPDIDSIINRARALKRTRGLVAVVVDYLQLLDEGNRDEQVALKSILKKAQRAAKRDRIAYIFLSQVGQQVDKRGQDSKASSRPEVNDMFGSSWMKFASKLMLGVYRPSKYEKVPRKPKRPGDPDYTRLYEMHPKGKSIYPMIMEIWVQKNILGEAEVCVPCLVQVETGKMVPMPEEVKRYIV